MKKNVFPTMLYVTEEPDGDSLWYNAKTSCEGHAEVGEKVTVGVYELKKVVAVRTTIIAEVRDA